LRTVYERRPAFDLLNQLLNMDEQWLVDVESCSGALSNLNVIKAVGVNLVTADGRTAPGLVAESAALAGH
jgi:hypothetical protein